MHHTFASRDEQQVLAAFLANTTSLHVPDDAIVMITVQAQPSEALLSSLADMVEHAVDCLNRVTGPPDTDKTSYEVLTGEKPKILPILPFGCRAYPVKPRPAYSARTSARSCARCC